MSDAVSDSRRRGYIPYDDALYASAHALQQRVGVIDLHVDSIIQQRLFRYDLLKRHRAGFTGQPLWWHADLPRMVEAGYRGACMGVHYWPWESERGWREAMRQLDYLDRVAAMFPGAYRVSHPGQWADAPEGSLLLSAGIEGAHMLNGEVSRVKELAERGVAYLTLAHFSANRAVTPARGRGANERDGLTPLGCELVRALNRFGIVVDVAHVNTPGVLDACAQTSAPVFCTHTGVKAVHDVARNISDDEIDAVAATDGAIGIIFGPGFLCGRFRAGTTVVLDHIDHIASRVGIRHVVIGSDYDGWLPSIVSDHRDCRDIIKVTHGLLARGYSEEEVAGVLRGNAERVFAGALAAAVEGPYASA